MARRRSPTFFRRKGAAIAFFVLALAALVLCTYIGLGMLTKYHYEDVLPEDAPLRVRFPEDDNYQLPEVTPTPLPVATPTPLPTHMPSPSGTPIPLSLYSIQDTRMTMPSAAEALGEAHLTAMTVSAADDSRTVTVTGWAYLYGCDAQSSTIYLVTLPRSSVGQRFYEAQVLPGSSGVQHDVSSGTNLERADFRAVFSVRAYPEGPYRMGVLVVNRADKRNVTQGYFELDAQDQFTVKGNTVVGVG